MDELSQGGMALSTRSWNFSGMACRGTERRYTTAHAPRRKKTTRKSIARRTDSNGRDVGRYHAVRGRRSPFRGDTGFGASSESGARADRRGLEGLSAALFAPPFFAMTLEVEASPARLRPSRETDSAPRESRPRGRPPV